MEKIFSKEILEKNIQIKKEIKEFLFGDNDVEYKRLVNELDVWESEVFKLIYQNMNFLTLSDYEKWSKQNDNEVSEMFKIMQSLPPEEKKEYNKKIIEKAIVYQNDDIYIISILDYFFGYCFANLLVCSKENDKKITTLQKCLIEESSEDY